MSLWTLRIGFALAILGLALLSPLGDLLPVDFWWSLKGWFKSEPTPTSAAFFRVVPGEQSRVVEFALIGIGSALVGASLYLRRRK
jgi:hypothetical protein